MKLSWLGHASFLITADSGLTVVTDPYGQDIFPHTAPAADIVTLSHDHFDHCAVETLPDTGVVLSGEGVWEYEGMKITGLASFHDGEQGKKRGKNTVYVFECDGQKIVHLGDLGHMPDETLLAAIKNADALLVPIGGVYTLEPEKAAELIALAAPVTAVPMHFRLKGHSMDVLDDGGRFLAALPENTKVQKMDFLFLPGPEGVAVLQAK